MKKTRGAKAKRSQVREKSYDDYASIWTPLGGHGGQANPDIYGNSPAPTPFDMSAAFSDIVYACVELVASAVAKEAGKYRLCAATRPNDPAPRNFTRAFNSGTLHKLQEAYPRYTRKALQVQEVIDHGVLDLLDKPNAYQSFEQLIKCTLIYRELVGSAFWLIGRTDVQDRGRIVSYPSELRLLVSHLVSIVYDEETGEITGYQYQCGDKPVFYPATDVIHFRHTMNPVDPTGFGLSPLSAVWQRFQLLRQEQSSWQAVLTNMATPSALVSPSEGETFTPTQAERISKQVTQRFRMGNQGGVWVVQDAMTYTPLSTPPRDLAALQMYDGIKASICGEYRVPRQLIDLSDTANEASEVAIRSFQRFKVLPTTDEILDDISRAICPERMFLASPSVVEPDRVFELQRTLSLTSGNITTLNEGRAEQGYGPIPGGDKLLCQITNTGTASAQTFQTNAMPSAAARTKGYKSTPPDPKKLGEVLSRLYSELGQEVMGQFKGFGQDIATKAFIPIGQWTERMRAELTPVLRVYAEQGMDAVLAEIGGDIGVRNLAVQKLAEAVNRAALALADSTLSTTELSVSAAVDELRAAVQGGLEAGEGTKLLTERVQSIFKDLSENRAWLIADTEATRAKMTGEVIAVKESGVDAKKKWLPDSLACPECRSYAAKGAIPIDEPFAIKGSGPYGKVNHPPDSHPGCRCSLQYQFEG